MVCYNYNDAGYCTGDGIEVAKYNWDGFFGGAALGRVGGAGARWRLFRSNAVALGEQYVATARLQLGADWRVMRNIGIPIVAVLSSLLALVIASSQRKIPSDILGSNETASFSAYLVEDMDFLWKPGQSGYQHVWPEMKFEWRIIVGTLIGSLGAAFGSVGGVGGGGIFVPMLILIIGFDPKSATAISKCMITGAAVSTVYFNLKLKHPTFDIPLIDYNLVMLMMPMIMLGITVGVSLSVVFADWMITLLLIIMHLNQGILQGVDTWKKETIIKQETAKLLEYIATASEAADYSSLPTGPEREDTRQTQVSILGNIYWKELGLISFVWLAYFVLQIVKTHTDTCSTTFWIVNFLQIPASLGVHLCQAIGLHQGWRVVPSKGDQGTNWSLHHLILCSFCATLAGIIGGLLGIGSGFVMGPMFLEFGIPPQVASASAMLGMTYSASISIVQYYLLNRFPVPYAVYLTIVATAAAYIGQHVIDRLVTKFGRASLIIFVLAFTIFVSAIALGGVGVSDAIQKIQRNEYMGFDDFCN
ncbi:sulfite exporter TauE/SafE family protein 3-like [Prosopis cineraria]|uniref:sulfite exporter TauE/SafE family protein 3-like n=1 Tax=Prosopis cineraria TaxID=364024 RepID=UPI00240EE8D6|nr:sulfite exporter TauE/SafE family protein 3-like [Prosopis cineraria]